MNLKLNDLVLIPRSWIVPFYVSQINHSAFERSISNIINTFDVVVRTGRYALPGWGNTGVENSLTGKSRFSIVKITRKSQIELVQLIAKHYGALKITNMQDLAISFQKDFLKQRSEIFDPSDRDRQRQYTGGPLDRSWDHLRQSVEERDLPIYAGYDAVYIRMKKLRRKACDEDIFLDSDGEDKYLVSSKDIKNLKDIQTTFPKGFQKLYWTPWVQGVLGRMEIRNIESVKQKDLLKGVEW